MKPALTLLVALVLAPILSAAAPVPVLSVGIAVRDISPELPIWLSGYAARRRPADKIDQPLLVQALALENATGERFVFVALDNCEVSHAFNRPLIEEFSTRFGLKTGEVMIVSSHTHSAPVLVDTLAGMFQLPEIDRERIQQYSESLRSQIIGVVGAALADAQPALLEHGVGRATFAMNRRVYQGDRIVFGENPDGPVDWEVPVLKIKRTNDTLRAVVFGYACHGTSIAGEDFYIVSGDYMAYARQHLEAHYPGATALYLTGMGADSNPSPRGALFDAKRHGLELAGAVAGVLNRPMRPVRGPFRLAYAEVDLPLMDPPGHEQLDRDAQSEDTYIRNRARSTLGLIEQGKAVASSVRLPLAAVRIGNDLTIVAMAGEVVVDYAIRFKRLFAADHPWTIGYAYEVPCYIPSVRILKEGGYEAQSSLIYYGIYGPFRSTIEGLLIQKMTELVRQTRTMGP